MNRKCIFVFLIVMSICSPAHSREPIDGRYLGMAGSNTAVAEGLEYLGGNPATLSVEKSFGFEILLLSARFSMSNNSLSLDDYQKHFTTGDELTGGEIDDLLGGIPDSGLRVDGFAGVRAISFCTGPFGFGVTGTGKGFASLPKEAIEFTFYGNREIRELEFDQLEGESWSGIALNFSGARVLSGNPQNGSPFLSAGLNLKYILGLFYAGIEETAGGIETTDQFILADASMLLKTSGGGRGYGADVGMFARVSQRWSLSLHCNNLLGKISWNDANEMTSFQFEADSLNILDEETIELSNHDTTYSTGSFSMGLPRILNLATAFRASPGLVLTAAWRQGLDNRLGNSTVPGFSLGVEYTPIYFLPLRAGFAFGGNNAFATGLGIGINVGCWSLDIGYLNHSFDWFRSAKSIDLAATTRLRF
jgi:hypothetical protein